MSIVYKTIPQDDQTVTPFKVYKSWEYTGTSATRFKGLYSASIFLGTAIKPDPSNYTGQLMSLDFDRESDTNDASRLLNTHLQNTPAGMLWYSLKHKYFNDYNDFISFAGNAEPLNLNTNSTDWDGLTFTTTTASLNKSYNFIEDKTNPSGSYRLPSIASVISIPQIKFGEEIKPGSFEIIVTCSYGDAVVNNPIIYKLVDDGKGNLIDISIGNSELISKENQILYLGFNESEYENISKYNQADPRYPTSIDYYNVTVNTSSLFDTISGSLLDVYYGLAAYFNNSYIRIDGTPSYFNPKIEDDFTICFFVNLTNTTQKQYLITKRGLARDYGLISRDGRRSAGNVWNLNENIYPYNIYIENDTIYAEASDGTTKVILQAPVFPGGANHIAFIKRGNSYELWLSNVMEDSSTVNLSTITNKSDIFIGSLATQESNLNSTNNPIINGGMLDEIRIFNRALLGNEIDSLSNILIRTSALPNFSAGKIFYKEGIAIINNVNPKYGTKYGNFNNSGYLTTLPFASSLYNNSPNTIFHNGAGSGASTSAFRNLNTSGSVNNITVKWNSTVTIYENEILCRIREDEFNVTLNPTILKNQENSYIPQDYVYNDEFTPYITTVGLYNDKAELLAIGKLANPIKKRPDVDLNIVIRFDQ